MSLVASESSFELCKAKVADAKVLENQGSILIPIGDKKSLLYSKTPPKTKIYKQDKKLHLYIVDDVSDFAYPFKLNSMPSQSLASVGLSGVHLGEMLKSSDSSKLDGFSVCPDEFGLILSNCCAIEGISTPDGVITKDKIEKFLTKADEPKTTTNAKVTTKQKVAPKQVAQQPKTDIFIQFGIHFNENLDVIKIEPSATKYGLKLGDRLLMIDSAAIKNLAEAKKGMQKGKNLLFQRENFQFFVKLY